MSNTLERAEPNGSHIIIPEVNEHVATVYYQNFFVRRGTEVDESERYITFTSTVERSPIPQSFACRSDSTKYGCYLLK